MKIYLFLLSVVSMTSLTGMFDGEGPVVKTFHPHAGNSVEQVALVIVICIQEALEV